jgi:hypothetical protein
MFHIGMMEKGILPRIEDFFPLVEEVGKVIVRF